MVCDRLMMDDDDDDWTIYARMLRVLLLARKKYE